MKYLIDYNLTEKDIEDINESLSEEEWIMLTTSTSKIESILDYLQSLGITDFKELFINRRNVLYQNVEKIDKRINECNIPDIIEKLQENIHNFDLLDL